MAEAVVVVENTWMDALIIVGAGIFIGGVTALVTVLLDNELTDDGVTFFLGFFHSWAVYFGLPIFLLVLFLWAAGYIRNGWFVWGTLAWWFSWVINAYLFSYVLPILNILP